MREIIKVSVEDAQPSTEDVFMFHGIPADKKPSDTTRELLEQVREVYASAAHCVGMYADVTTRQFESIYHGEGLNEKVTPLDTIRRRADKLALFVVTIGQEVSQKIDELFKEHEYARAGMLDAFASAGAEKVADVVEMHYSGRLTDSDAMVLRYSPGYCGWHVSGQKKLFAFLKPEEIGVTLLDSYLMKPLKSISGVFVAGPKEIHVFSDTYPFCSECQTHSCQSRMQQLSGKKKE